ncbi:von Willebrand factor A domain containing 5B1, variant 2 [Balamuthia mandrillaris]
MALICLNTVRYLLFFSIVSRSRSRSRLSQAVVVHRICPLRRVTTASVIRSLREKDDIFKVNIGNLSPGKECTITMELVGELQAEGSDQIRFMLPTTIASRYQASTSTSEEQAVHSEIVSSSSSPSSSSPSYGLSLSLSVSMPSAIRSIESPSHPIKLDLQGERTASVSLAQQEVSMDRDFVLQVRQKDPYEARAWLDPDGEAAVVTFVPEVPSSVNEFRCEFIFLVDRSGSMSGELMSQAKSALQLFLRSLPEDCKFNIISFGSEYSTLFPESRSYDENTLQEASSHVDAMCANMGGTRLDDPLYYAYTIPWHEGYHRQIFLLTDGEVSNTDHIITLVQEHRERKVDSSVQATLDNGGCSFPVTAQNYHNQFYYHCDTCFPNTNDGCCVVCKETCHKGHKLSKLPKFGGFYCDCGNRGSRKCRSLHSSSQRSSSSSSSSSSSATFLPSPKELANQLPSVRLFSLGIGHSVSRSLVRGVARAGGGTAEFVTPGERLESTVIRQLNLSTQPSIAGSGIQVVWPESMHVKNGKTQEIQLVPETIPSMFPGSRYTLFGLLKQANRSVKYGTEEDKPNPSKKLRTEQAETKGEEEEERAEQDSKDKDKEETTTQEVMELEAKAQGEKEEAYFTENDPDSVVLILDMEPNVSDVVRLSVPLRGTQPGIRQLAARARILELEQREAANEAPFKDEIISLSTRHQLLSRHTSFVAVEERAEATSGTLVRRVVPLTPAAHGGDSSSRRRRSRDRERDRCRRSRSRSRSPAKKRRRSSSSADSHSGFGHGGRGGGRGRGGRPLGRGGRGGRGGGRGGSAGVEQYQYSQHSPIRCAGGFENFHMINEQAREEHYTEISFSPATSSPSPSPSPSSEQHHQLLSRLVTLQRANGSYALTQDLVSILRSASSSLTLQKLQTSIPSAPPSSPPQTEEEELLRAWATALALAFLEVKLGALHMDWSMMAQKSKRWLAKVPGVDSKAWLSAATKLLSSH